jgi:hypothetical protein
MAFWACNQTSREASSPLEDTFEPKGEMADLVYNPMRSDGTLDSTYLPILTWEEVVYDFGTIIEGDIVIREFHFTNTGTAPLLIVNASSTCGCTIPEWPKNPIPPDSSGFIKVKFNSLDKMGDQNKVVTIFANTFPNTTKIALKGKVDLKN